MIKQVSVRSKGFELMDGVYVTSPLQNLESSLVGTKYISIVCRTTNYNLVELTVLNNSSGIELLGSTSSDIPYVNIGLPSNGNPREQSMWKTALPLDILDFRLEFWEKEYRELVLYHTDRFIIVQSTWLQVQIDLKYIKTIPKHSIFVGTSYGFDYLSEGYSNDTESKI